MTAPPVVTALDPSMRDFSTSRKPVQFVIDGDVFSGPCEVAAELLVDYGERFNRADEGRTQLDDLKDLMSIFLWEEDFTRLCARLGDKRHPIGLKQLDDVAEWLTEYHGMRPTKPPSDSSSRSSNPASGTSSTDSAPVEDSTPDVSPSPDS